MTLMEKSHEYVGLLKTMLESSLRIRTLIILWIVMIGCGLHIISVNLNNDNHSVMHGSSSNGNSNSKEIIREKRSSADLDYLEDVGTRIKRADPIGKIRDIRDKIENTVEKVGDKIYGFKDGLESILTDGTIIEEGYLDAIRDGFKNLRNISGVKGLGLRSLESKIAVRVADDFAFAFIDRINVHLDKLALHIQRLFKVCTHYYFFIWSAVGVISSLIGIFGIHENLWRCLTWSVFFFYFSIFSFVVILLELNIDSSTEFRMLVLLELTGALCINFKESMILINMGILLITGLSLYFMYIVKKCRSAILEEGTDMKSDSNIKVSDKKSQLDDLA